MLDLLDLDNETLHLLFKPSPIIFRKETSVLEFDNGNNKGIGMPITNTINPRQNFFIRWVKFNFFKKESNVKGF